MSPAKILGWLAFWKPQAKPATPKPAQQGLAVVWGVPQKIQLIHDCPPGKIRLRFRNNRTGKAYFKTSDGIRVFVIERREGRWLINPKLEEGRNLRAQPKPVVLDNSENL